MQPSCFTSPAAPAASDVADGPLVEALVTFAAVFRKHCVTGTNSLNYVSLRQMMRLLQASNERNAAGGMTCASSATSDEITRTFVCKLHETSAELTCILSCTFLFPTHDIKALFFHFFIHSVQKL